MGHKRGIHDGQPTRASQGLGSHCQHRGRMYKDEESRRWRCIECAEQAGEKIKQYNRTYHAKQKRLKK